MLSSGEWREREFDPRTAEAVRAALPPGFPAALARVLASRGVTSETLAGYLSPDMRSLPPPTALPGVAECVDAILDAVERRRKIVATTPSV